jgi:phosphotransferase system HPr (HPr) family protein
MSETSATRNVVVTDPVGMHLRTAAAVAKTVSRHNSQVTLVAGGRRVAGDDLWTMMGMGVLPGATVTLEAVGPDAALVLDALEPLFAGQFGDEAEKTA